MSGLIDPAFRALSNNWGSSPVTVINAFIFVLATTQFGLRTNYYWSSNFLTRQFPFYPNGNLLQKAILINDNAVTRYNFSVAKNLPSAVTFDFIVVGAGTAGSVVASRLSENSARTVLLIEAGDVELPESFVPQFFPFNLNNSNVYNNTAEIVPTSSNAFKRGCSFMYGKQMGGSSATNAMLYVCGNDRDYDGWAAAGNTGWDYDSLLPYFTKAETNLDADIVSANPTYHGTSGPLPVGNYITTDSYAPILRTAYTELGYQELQDFNARQYNGVVRAQGTLKNGERCNSARSFLYPNTGRDNLYIMRQSLVTSLIFSGTTVTGVNVRTPEIGNTYLKMYASKEVIVSAGAIGSPKLLLLSGIGRSADLALVGIPQVKDLAVGYNLHDHVMAILFIKLNPDAPSQGFDDVLYDAQNYYFTRTGPFASLGSMNTIGFINTLSTTATYPDIEYIHYRFMKSQEYLKQILANFGYKDSYIVKVVCENADYEIVLVFTTLLNPASAGKISLASADPLMAPKITTNFFAVPSDVDTMVRGIKKLNDLIKTPAMVAISASFVKFDIDECDTITYDPVTPSDDYWRCYIKYVTACEWHTTGTCKMGPSTDTEAVVDADLKVHGISKLRVVDASIMPTVPSSNTQCSCYMIGEIGATKIAASHP